MDFFNSKITCFPCCFDGNGLTNTWAHTEFVQPYHTSLTGNQTFLVKRMSYTGNHLHLCRLDKLRPVTWTYLIYSCCLLSSRKLDSHLMTFCFCKKVDIIDYTIRIPATQVHTLHWKLPPRFKCVTCTDDLKR